MDKRHHELRLTSPRPAVWLLRQTLRFAANTDHWRPHPNGIIPEGMGIGPHCVVIYTQRKPVACVALVATGRSPHAVRLTNIFPGESGYIPPNEYNLIAERLVKDFRHYVRRKRLPIKFCLSVFRLSLETAIPSKKCRDYFQSYLAGDPLTFHPSDIHSLDQFICALHRHHATPDLDALVAFLIERRRWPASAAEIVRNRILIGSKVLAAHQRFR